MPRSGREAAPPLLLVHGSLDRSAGLLKLSRRLDERFRVLRYDRRGYGRSMPHDGPFDMAAQVDDAVEVLVAAKATVCRDRRWWWVTATAATSPGARRSAPGARGRRGRVRVAVVVARLVAGFHGGRRCHGVARRSGRGRRAVHAAAHRRCPLGSAAADDEAGAPGRGPGDGGRADRPARHRAVVARADRRAGAGDVR